MTALFSPHWLEEFSEHLVPAPAPQHIFLAAEFKDSFGAVGRLKDLIEAGHRAPMPNWPGL